MKGFSIEEKARAYDEAIKKAGERYNKEYTSTLERSTLAYVFPELKESKDEKMTKHIIQILKDNFSGEDTDKCIAWLEKQGEQKPTNKVEPKFKVDDWVVIKQ